jgi:GGDEF domain-containing protein
VALRDRIRRQERALRSLVKMEPELRAALDHLRSKGVDPEHQRTIMRRLFVDQMVPGMGNALSYNDFLTRPRDGGVHIRMDANDFGSINKQHGWETGNAAIKSVGEAIRSALDEVTDPDEKTDRENPHDDDPYQHKLWRIGGDEFHAHVPDHDTAARFARAVRTKLESIAPINGTHGLSLSMGFGHDPSNAEAALLQAKAAKKASGYRQGFARSHAHSLVPGSSGAVPTAPDDLPLARPRPPNGEAVLAGALPPAEPQQHRQ